MTHDFVGEHRCAIWGAKRFLTETVSNQSILVYRAKKTFVYTGVVWKQNIELRWFAMIYEQLRVL